LFNHNVRKGLVEERKGGMIREGKLW
jgi:hypothetical protein